MPYTLVFQAHRSLEHFSTAATDPIHSHPILSPSMPSFPSIQSTLSANRQSGFSLVEVALSLATISVGFISILGLMGSGLTQFRTVMDITVSAQIAQRVINDAQQADFKRLVDAKAIAGLPPSPELSFRAPSWDAPAFRYFDSEGNELPTTENGELEAAERARAIYQVNVRIRPYANVPRASQVQVPQLAQVTVQVAHAPSGHLDVVSDEGANQNLFKASGSPVYTYAALVGANE